MLKIIFNIQKAYLVFKRQIRKGIIIWILLGELCEKQKLDGQAKLIMMLIYETSPLVKYEIKHQLRAIKHRQESAALWKYWNPLVQLNSGLRRFNFSDNLADYRDEIKFFTAK